MHNAVFVSSRRASSHFLLLGRSSTASLSLSWESGLSGCVCRMETACIKAEQTKAVAKQAHADAVLARQKAVEFEHVELHVGMFQRCFSVSMYLVQTCEKIERKLQ